MFQRTIKWIAEHSPGVLVWLYRVSVRLLIATCRCRAHGLDAFVKAANAGKCALILWHDKLAIIAALLKKCAPELNYIAVISNSRDGRMLAKLASSYKQCEILYVSRNGRQRALRRMVNALQEGTRVVVMTPDGPTGPKHQLKQGIAVAALQTGASVVTLSWKANRSWFLNTWDKMALPKPFSKIDIYFGEPRLFESTTHVDQVTEELQKQLLVLEQKTG